MSRRHFHNGVPEKLDEIIERLFQDAFIVCMGSPDFLTLYDRPDAISLDAFNAKGTHIRGAGEEDWNG